MKLKIATRKSPLARWQAEYVAHHLKKNHPELQIEYLFYSTQGDHHLNRSLMNLGGKSLFVKELQQALFEKNADIAVHSIKDLASKNTPGLILAAVCSREDPRDVLISHHHNLDQLGENAIIGTSSPRRECLLHSYRADFNIQLLRGNVGSRIEKFKRGDFDAIILAASGLKRLGLENNISAYLDPGYFVPAIGQGAIGVECREEDHNILRLVQTINHNESNICIQAERAVNHCLQGDCFTPLGAYAKLTIQNQLVLNAMIGSVDGKQILRCEKIADLSSAQLLGVAVANDLLRQGAEKFLNPKKGEKYV